MGTSIIPPLNPILKKIEHNFDSFTPEGNVRNGFAAARWCINNGLYQQALTILQESVVSFFALRHDIDIFDKDNRGLINSAYAFLAKNDDKMAELVSDKLLQATKGEFSALTELRNDYNHSGMRMEAVDNPQKIVQKLEQLLCSFDEKLFQAEEDKPQSETDNLIVAESDEVEA